MFLKQLEVIGFKSFAKKVSVEFVPGVTAVVGPNGSGKSNITDAIKWVLGEQSAKTLRGSKMEDIIFAGSDGSKPLNMAEVTLTLDNNDQYLAYDFSEISVTRRVFRSGDSEYLLNGQTCRLKDIVELFMDSGLGREAYSIISQGKIDDILNSKADDKRKIFEEAAGVLKYKTRKQSAEKKLNESEDHLNRVEDILHELGEQAGPLEEQASIAKDFLEKKELLEQVEVALLAHDIEEAHDEWEKRSKSVENLTDEQNEWSEGIRNKDAVHDVKRSELKALDESIEELQEALMLSSEMLEKYEGQKNVLHERQKHARENADDIEKRMDMLEKKSRDGAEALKAENKLLKEENNTWKNLQRQLGEKVKQYNYYNQDLDQMIDRLKSDYFDVLNEQTSIGNECRYLKEQKAQIERKSDRLLHSANDIQQMIDDVTNRKKAAESERKQKIEELNSQKTSYKELKHTIEAKQQDYKKQIDALNKISQFIQQALSRKDMLEALNDDYAGFFHGVKKVLKARGKGLDGIHGAVAELAHVKRSYETAIETALGGAMQHVVVSEERHARQAIHFLKQQQAGRATFLPLSVVKPKVIPQRDINRVSQHPSLVGAAASLVESNDVYKPIIHHLLGSIIVAKDLKGANELAKQLGYRYRIVTLEGDVVSPGGAMSGGSQKQKSTSLLGRQREIDQLASQIEEMKDKKHELDKAVSELKAVIIDLELEIDALRESIQELSIDNQKRESSLREIVIEEKNIMERGQLLKREKSDFNQELEGITKRIQELGKQQKLNKEKEVELNKEIESMAKQKKHQEVSKDELQSEVTELKVKTARHQQIVSHQKDKTERMKEQLDSINSDLNEAKRAVEHLGDSLTNQALDQDTIDDKINSCRKDKQALTLWLKERKDRRIVLQEDISCEETAIKAEKRKLQALSEELRTHEIALGRLDVELDNLLNALRADYEMSFEYAKEHFPLTMAPDVARKQVKLIKKAIDELGTVNIGSIDEYERVSSRLNFLTEQRQDLLNAKATLVNVMNEMDEEVRKRFTETFYSVREHFQDIFKALFGGGKADLCLTDPEDLLYSGVEILAQPPGKKLQHLSLLSGGERALTAIALLFAILKVRPVPFCVLDEVEAALDDANVDRYAGYLKAFSKETQFIVVTHRKGTMENADVLYGVTMQESGVSKLVSVRLEETKELVETR
ncbi:condensin subunit Smc [Scopulibacillus darangshiensis]|uniref:Chromosome partition protein Smc n=1 Tax=Scopulibacillus darangshiensis TaxID=442528 RepID=A0A4R2P348_9BACL|nr:chromosome segregation protein SMC [Scopulibacillus darangshiensis]TCP29150.1 condensin subunit Smc [Scopulibacillus darangshiensis]